MCLFQRSKFASNFADDMPRGSRAISAKPAPAAQPVIVSKRLSAGAHSIILTK